VRTLDLNSCSTLSGVLVECLAHVALNLSFIHYITLHYNTLIRCSVPAEIVSVPAQTIVNSGDSVTIECVVRANPINVDRLVTWSRVGYDFDSRTKIEYPEPGKSRLTFSAVDRTDAGLFECRASNGIGSESLAKAKLVVRCESIYL